MGERAGIVECRTAGALDELVTEAALSRARVRGDQDDSRSTGLGLAQRPLEQAELVLAADEAREAARPGALEAAPDLARTPQLEHAHGDACALETLFPTVEEVEEARREARGLLGHTDAAWWRQLLHPGGEPDDVPLRGVVHAQVVADPPHDDLAGVQAHPHRELEPALAPHVFGERAELAGQIQGGRTGALGVVVVGEEDGDQLALAPERALGRKNLLDEMPRRVGARLEGDCRRREGRATIVAEPRASGVLVLTESAAHWALAHLSLIRVQVT